MADPPTIPVCELEQVTPDGYLHLRLAGCPVLARLHGLDWPRTPGPHGEALAQLIQQLADQHQRITFRCLEPPRPALVRLQLDGRDLTTQLRQHFRAAASS